jgi:hypothetical protein
MYEMHPALFLKSGCDNRLGSWLLVFLIDSSLLGNEHVLSVSEVAMNAMSKIYAWHDMKFSNYNWMVND